MVSEKRFMVTLFNDFQLTDLIKAIQSKADDHSAIENCIFLCKGRRLSFDDHLVFQTQKRKLINDGDVIFIGKRIKNCQINWCHVESQTNEVKF